MAKYEVINKKIKHSWNCLVNPFKGTGNDKIENHSDLFCTCVVMTDVVM
jgi:hypothetical protein